MAKVFFPQESSQMNPSLPPLLAARHLQVSGVNRWWGPGSPLRGGQEVRALTSWRG